MSSQRAFQKGKLDLTQVEGLADLLNAETDGQRRQALRVAGGDLGRKYETWRRILLGDVAHCEAVLDFGQRESIGSLRGTEVIPTIDSLAGNIERIRLNPVSHGEMVRSGVRVVLLGAPNVGKSSLLN